MKALNICVIGGGAAGFFGALSCAQHFPHHTIKILEKTRQVLSKVRISGGGRCNVTHACFEPQQLIKNYPRGQQELRGPFARFQPRDTIDWFADKGIILKTEEDGRMFPTTDSSQTIIDCLVKQMNKHSIQLCIEHGVEKIARKGATFLITFTNQQTIECDRILLTTGSTAKIYPILEELGHSIVPLVPSLFTFNLPKSPFLELAGISLEDVQVDLPQFKLHQRGPCLLTHWGMSGPAVLKLSAWAARHLHAAHYKGAVVVNWVPYLNEDEVRQALNAFKKKSAAKLMGNDSPFALPKQFWKKLLLLAGQLEEVRWATVSQKQLNQLVLQLRSTQLDLDGKTTYKQEFVTCGGIALNQVNFKTMESRIVPNLYFAGEVLDIDGITGGFNFQNAWTTGWIAGQSIGRSD